MGYFIETNDELFANRVNQFATELPNYATLLGFTKSEVDEATADGAYIVWAVKAESIYDDYASAHKHHVDLARHNKEGKQLTPPPAPVLPAMPAVVPAGIQPRFAQKAKKAKASPNYTESIGRALGIVGTAAPAVAQGANNTDVPDLKVGESAGYPTLSFHLLGYKAVNLYKDKGDGNYAFYKTLHKSPHQDKQLPAPGATATYRYKAVYVVNDEEVGKFSPEVSISVKGR